MRGECSSCRHRGSRKRDGGSLSPAAGAAVVGALLLLPAVADLQSARSEDAAVTGALRAAIASAAPPRLEWRGETGLSIAVSVEAGNLRVSGRCHAGRPVAITGQRLGKPVQTDCTEGRYSAIAGASPSGARGEIVASQVFFDGSILAARGVPAAVPGHERSMPAQLLASVIETAAPGDVLRVAPGTYKDFAVTLPAGKGGALGRPVLIDGGNAVVFTGRVRLNIRSSDVVVKGFAFRDVGPGAVSIYGVRVRLTESEFLNCGDRRKTQSQCIMIAGGSAEAEVDFNRFVGSRSMSIKVRAGPPGSPRQPVNVRIHHNLFRDIERLSDNGQEPIQVAGPGGAGAKGVRLATRIEHNVFYRAEGDREAISMKLADTSVRWNTFRDMDAAPNLRGAADNVVSDNVLLRTRPIRIAGRGHVIERNVVLCPRRHSPAFFVSHGSRGYGVAQGNVVRENIIAVERAAFVFGTQTQPVEVTASENRILDNRIYLPPTAKAVKIAPQDIAAEVTNANSISTDAQGPSLCR